VFQHTRLMLELLPKNVSVPLVFSVILHDVAKPRTAMVDADGRIRFNEHDRIGAEMTEQIMERLRDRKSTRLNSSHRTISYAVFLLVLHSFPTRRSSDLCLSAHSINAGAFAEKCFRAPRFQRHPSRCRQTEDGNGGRGRPHPF